MKKSRVLFVINTLDRGGAERSLINTFCEKDFSDRQVDLLVLTGKARLIDEVPEYVHLLNKHTYRSRIGLFFRCLYAVFYRGYIFRRFRYFAGNFIRMIRERRFLADKLLWEAIAFSAPAAEGCYDEAIAYTEGGSAYYVADRTDALKKTALIHIDMQMAGYCRNLDLDHYDRFDSIGAASEDARISFLNEYPELTERTFLFDNPLNVNRIESMSHLDTGIHFNTDGLRIFTAERLVEQKACDVSVRAASIMKEKGIKFEWIVAGNGPEKGNLKRLIRKLSLTDEFILTGEIDNPYALMKECDVYVQATSYEGKSMSVREALALGKPVVVSDRSGNSIKADRETVVPLSPEGIAEGIIAFQENRE